MGCIWILLFVTTLNAHQAFCGLLPTPVQFFVENAGLCTGADAVGNSFLDVDIEVGKFNRTTVTISGTFTLKEDAPLDLQVEIKMYRLNDRMWYEHPLVRVPIQSVCAMAETDQNYWPNINKVTNITKVCPFLKGEYMVDNAVLSFQNIPEFIEKGCWKGNVYFYHQEERVGCVYVAGKLLNEVRNKPPMCVS